MSELIIEAANLGKRYTIGRAWRRRKNLRDAIMGAVTLPFRNFRTLRARGSATGADSFWALRDVTFSLQTGEVLGIIGRNGAGKSTLLKILSRITDPSEGRVDIYGRVGSLLEVGTGFHPELTGRDNIFLNGSILGMDRGYIERRFDEIVDFSGISNFLDTQVKYYSSGMRVRLAFAVAAHLEPEVLIIDEVLAVGDAEFQRKCLRKMDDVGRAGRTVLFVSHDMGAIRRLCTRAIMLDSGRIVAEGVTAEVVGRYLADSLSRSSGDLALPGRWIDLSDAVRSGRGEPRFSAISYRSDRADLAFAAYTNGPLEFDLAIDAVDPRFIRSLAVRIMDQNGQRLLSADLASFDETLRLAKGRTIVRVRIESLHLLPGHYVVGLRTSERLEGEAHDEVETAIRFEVVGTGGQSGSAPAWGAVACNFSVAAVREGAGASTTSIAALG